MFQETTLAVTEQAVDLAAANFKPGNCPPNLIASEEGPPQEDDGSGPVARPQGNCAATTRHAAGERLQAVGGLQGFVSNLAHPSAAYAASSRDASRRAHVPPPRSIGSIAARRSPYAAPAAASTCGTEACACPRSRDGSGGVLRRPWLALALD
jgi:hypothetical protein